MGVLVYIAWRLNAITFGEKIFCMKTGILHEAKLNAICLSECRISLNLGYCIKAPCNIYITP